MLKFYIYLHQICSDKFLTRNVIYPVRKFYFENTVKFCYKDYSKLRPPSLLRPLVLLPKCYF